MSLPCLQLKPRFAEQDREYQEVKRENILKLSQCAWSLSTCLTRILTALVQKATHWGTPKKLMLTFRNIWEVFDTSLPDACWLRWASPHATSANEISCFKFRSCCSLPQDLIRQCNRWCTYWGWHFDWIACHEVDDLFFIKKHLR